MPKVSVIIPIYNVEQYLAACLDSVINQTLKDVEIICINDGSTDASLEILKEYAQKDDRFIVRTQENKGQSAARNVGLQIAHGEYIYFMDSDDLIELSCLDKLYSVATENNLDVLYFNADAFFDTEELKKQHSNYCTYYDRKGLYEKCLNGKKLLEEMEHNGDYRPSPCLQLLRHNFLKKHNIKFFEGIIHEDNLFSFLCIMQAERAMHINEILFHRRVRENSTMTKTKTAKNMVGYFICFIEMVKFCLHENIEDEICKKQVMTILRNARNIYRDLNEEEQNKIIWEKNSFESFMYEVLVKQHVNIEKRLGKKKDSYSLEEVLAIEYQLSQIYQSKSYKIGRTITWLPRKIKGGIRCYQEHGFMYTLQRCKVKLFSKFI